MREFIFGKIEAECPTSTFSLNLFIFMFAIIFINSVIIYINNNIKKQK